VKPPIRKLLPFLLVSVLGSPADGPIPGVPEWCCGYRDCRPADVRILQRGADEAAVVVDGRRLTLSPGRVFRSKKPGGWYCFRVGLAECRGGRVSPGCARCVVSGGHIVGEMRLIPAPALGPEKHLLLPEGGCRGCHR